MACGCDRCFWDGGLALLLRFRAGLGALTRVRPRLIHLILSLIIAQSPHILAAAEAGSRHVWRGWFCCHGCRKPAPLADPSVAMGKGSIERSPDSVACGGRIPGRWMQESAVFPQDLGAGGDALAVV